jgi:hypothetical protein
MSHYRHAVREVWLNGRKAAVGTAARGWGRSAVRPTARCSYACPWTMTRTDCRHPCPGLAGAVSGAWTWRASPWPASASTSGCVDRSCVAGPCCWSCRRTSTPRSRVGCGCGSSTTGAPTASTCSTSTGSVCGTCARTATTCSCWPGRRWTAGRQPALARRGHGPGGPAELRPRPRDGGRRGSPLRASGAAGTPPTAPARRTRRPLFPAAVAAPGRQRRARGSRDG